MAAKLKALKITEISLVPGGANPHAKVLLFKAAKCKTCGKPLDADDVAEGMKICTACTDAAASGGDPAAQPRPPAPKDSTEKRAYDMARDRARELVAKGHAPTIEQALLKVVEDDPALCRRVRTEAPTVPSPAVMKEAKPTAAYVELRKIAGGILERGEAPTIEQAISKAVNTNPALYRRHRQEEQSR